MGVAQATPEENLLRLADHLDAADVPQDIVWMKRAIEDIKAFYLEAMTAQPGEYDPAVLQQQFWSQTRFAAGIIEFYQYFQAQKHPQLQLVARLLASREAVGAATGPAAGTGELL